MADPRLRLDDRALVREQYADETRLAARKSVYADAEGPDPRELALEAVAAVAPAAVLEVGGGEGELAERIARETGARVVGIDQSQRMVELQRARAIDARVGDVVDLPFGDGEFDVALAAWMLYHVADIDRALAELARVLRPGGRLVAVTNGEQHLRELWEAFGFELPSSHWRFSRENGEEQLRRWFARVERLDADGWVNFDDGALRRYASSWVGPGSELELPPVETPLRVRRAPTVFVADKA